MKPIANGWWSCRLQRKQEVPQSLEDGTVPNCFRYTALLLLPLALSVSGCAALREARSPAVSSYSGCNVAFVLDGAGDFQATSLAMREVAAKGDWPLQVETFDWSHGYIRVIADQIDRKNMLAQAQRLAALVITYRQCHPAAEIYLVGHSAGCGVVLAAADTLPPDTVTRIVLLAPAVSTEYDLRPALCSTRTTIDVYYSIRDRLYLGLGTALFGTSDRRWDCRPAGRIGFQSASTPDEFCLYRKLRQFPWHPSMKETGNQGGHYGPYQKGFLQDCVLPLMTGHEPLAQQ